VIGVPVLVRHHAHHFLTLHLGAERAAHPAIRAGRDDAVLRLAFGDQRVLRESGRRARLYTRAARDALRLHEGDVLARRDARGKAPSLDGERQGALLLIAGAYAARADDALAGIEGKIGVALVLLGGEMVRSFIAVAHFAQADDARHILQLAMAIGGTRQTIQRVIGDIEFHHAATNVGDLLVLGGDFHALRHRRGARRGQALHALYLYEAQPAGAKGIELVRGTQLGNLDLRERGGAHHGSPFRYGDFAAVDREREGFRAKALRGA